MMPMVVRNELIYVNVLQTLKVPQRQGDVVVVLLLFYFWK